VVVAVLIIRPTWTLEAGFFPWFPFFWFFPFVGLLVVFFFVKWAFWGWGWGWSSGEWGYRGNAERILENRYARGELTREQFEQMRRDLRQVRSEIEAMTTNRIHDDERQENALPPLHLPQALEGLLRNKVALVTGASRGIGAAGAITFAKGVLKTESDRQNAGLLYIIAGTTMFLAISLAETLYPNYSVHANAISDLAATTALTSPLTETAGFVWGLGWLAGSYLLLRSTGRRRLMALYLLPAVGVLLAIISPENVNITIHSVGAVLAFVPGAIALLLSFRLIGSSLKYVALALGLTTLLGVSLEFGAYYSSLVQSTLGPGGTERIIVYPILAWLMLFGGYLSAENSE
jgi:hypothetical membrane protein/uncharacterized membrane protein